MADESISKPWLEQAKWLWAETRARFDILGQQASWILAADGVLIGLLVRTKLPAVHHNAWVVCGALAVVSAICAVMALRPRRLDDINVPLMREHWRSVLDGKFEKDPFLTFTEALLHGHDDSRQHGPGPLQSLVDAARRRGRFQFAAAFFLTTSILAAVAAMA